MLDVCKILNLMSRRLFLVFQYFKVKIFTICQVFPSNNVLTSICANTWVKYTIHAIQVLGIPTFLKQLQGCVIYSALVFIVINASFFFLSFIVSFSLYVEGFKYSSKNRTLTYSIQPSHLGLNGRIDARSKCFKGFQNILETDF